MAATRFCEKFHKLTTAAFYGQSRQPASMILYFTTQEMGETSLGLPSRLKPGLQAQRSEHRLQAEPESAGPVPTHDLTRTPFRLKPVLRAQNSAFIILAYLGHSSHPLGSIPRLP